VRFTVLLLLLSTGGCVLATGQAAEGAAAGPLAIDTLLLPGAISGHAYSANLTSLAAVAPADWAVTSGPLPAGMALTTDGRVYGTPATAGEFRFTVRVTDARKRTAQRQFTFVVSEADPQYGNAGDPYLLEGGAPDRKAGRIERCGPLAEGRSYILGANVSAADPGAICFTLQGAGIRLDLGGHTVTGRIYMNADLSGTSIFHGSVTCDYDTRNAWTGCVNLLSTSRVTAPLRVHHLTLTNTARDTPRALYIDWATSVPYRKGSFSVVLEHISSRIESAPKSIRTYNLGMTGTRQTVEIAYNDLFCGGAAAACQGATCYGVESCVFHGNRIRLEPNSTQENGRALVFDGHTGSGDAWNNLLIVNNSRGVRVRDSSNIVVHHNEFKMVSGTAVHLGDPDRGTNDAWIVVEHNLFEMAGGTAFMVRNLKGHVVARQNRFVVARPCPQCKGEVAHIRSPLRPGDVTEFTLRDNRGVNELESPQVLVEPGAEVFLCHSGVAGGPGKSHRAQACPVDSR